MSAVCKYNGTPLVLDNETVDRVASVYFTKAAERRRELIEQQLGVTSRPTTTAQGVAERETVS